MFIVHTTKITSRNGEEMSHPGRFQRVSQTAADHVASAPMAASGTDVQAYLAAVNVDNPSSMRLFETSAYLPDLPPDPEGFMRFRKDARVT